MVARKFFGRLSPRTVDPLRTLTSFEFSYTVHFVDRASGDSEGVTSSGVFVKPSRQDCTFAFQENTQKSRWAHLIVIGERAWASRRGEGQFEEVHDKGVRALRNLCASDPGFWAWNQEIGVFVLPRHMEGIADTFGGISTRRFDLAEAKASRLKQHLVRGPAGAEVGTHRVWLAEPGGWIAAFDIELEVDRPKMFPNRGAITPYGAGVQRASLRLSRANDSDIRVEMPAKDLNDG
jgi:hypothetical protein